MKNKELLKFRLKMLEMMKFDEKFPCSWPKQPLLLKKLKNQNVAHPRFVVICKIQAIALKWWE
jgi:hypothetical protein